jgi:transcriptional regulator with GAF, ATPase, and Fis domain
MEPESFRHRVEAFATAVNAVAPIVTLGFSRRVGPHRSLFTYWYPLGMGTHVVPDADGALEPHFQFFGAASVTMLPAPSSGEPMSLWFGFAGAEPLSDAQTAALTALAGRATDVLDGDETIDSKLDRLRRLDAAAELVPALTGVLDVRDVFHRVGSIAKNVLPHDAVSLGVFNDDLSEITLYARSGESDEPPSSPNPYPAALTSLWDSYVIDDLAGLPLERRERAAELGFRSSLRVAVRLGDRVIAGLDFMSRDAARYTSTDVAVGRRIAEQVALALSHHRLAEESRQLAALRERETNLEMLDGLLSAITGVLDIREVFSRISEIAGKVLPHDAMGLPILTDDREHVIPFVTVGLPAGTVPDIQPIPDSLRPMLTQPWDFDLVDHIPTHPELSKSRFATLGYRSLMRVPIRISGQLQGLLGFFSKKPAAYSHPDTLIARRIADHVAMMLSHQRLADEIRRASALEERAANLDMLDGLLNAITGVLDVREVFERISDIGNKVMPHDAVTIVTAEPESAILTLYATSGALKHLPTPFQMPAPDPSLLERSWDFLLIDDLQKDPVYHQAPSARAGMHAMLTLPFWVAGTLKGGVNFFSRTPGRFTRDDVPIARRIADHIALALSHHRLADEARQLDEARAKAAHLERLDSTLAAVVNMGELSETFERISAVTQNVVPHDALALPVLMPGGRQAKIYAAAGVRVKELPEIVDLPPSLLGDSQWEYQLIEDLQADANEAKTPGARLGFRSTLRMAIRFDKEWVAGLAFLSLAPSAFKASDVPVARRIADRIAYTLSRERRLEAFRKADEAAARAARLESRVRALTDELDARAGYRRVIGESPSWRQVLTQATQVASTETTVLLLGESGTGKEVVARLLHRASQRREGPFVALNCAALPEHLLEAELFGYERGAFTGAMQSKPGQLEQASSGVLFLDEVGEMSLSAQAKFLRVLQEREFQRLGGTRILRTDARIIAATNRDLHKAMGQGHFREDLFYRLNVFAIRLPALRDRRDDVLPLSEAFLAEFGRAFGRPPAGISREARQTLLAYHWPGNVRELRNILERAAILCDGGLITGEHLAIGPSPVRIEPPAPIVVESMPAPAAAPPPPASRGGEDLKSVERAMIEEALQNARFNKSKAAKDLGLSRHQLYVRMRRYGLE